MSLGVESITALGADNNSSSDLLVSYISFDTFTELILMMTY